MSVRVLGWALREAPVTNKGDLLTLIVLADHAHDDGDGAFPSVETIARLARLSPRGAQKALRKLASAGLLKATHRAGKTTPQRTRAAWLDTGVRCPGRSQASRSTRPLA